MCRSFYNLVLLACCFAAVSCNIGIAPVETFPTVITAEDQLAPSVRLSNDRFPNLVNLDHLQLSAEQRAASTIQSYQRRGTAVHQNNSPEPDFQRLLRLFKTVKASTHLAKTELSPVLVEDPSFQAYTLGGVDIVFHHPVVTELTNDELAFVIAHEIAHLALNHVGQTISRDIINTADPQDARRQGDFFSISNEQDADMLALVYVNLAGFDGFAAARIFARMSKDNAAGKYDLFAATHPQTQDRSDRLHQLAKRFTAQSGAYQQRNLLNCNPLFCND